MAVWLVAALIVQGGCDDGARSEARGDPIVDSSTIDGRLQRACAELRATERVPVLCPTWLPSARSGTRRYEGYTLSQRDFESSRCAYLTEMGYTGRGEGRTVPFHVLFGGRCRKFPLTASRGVWPPRERGNYLRLTTREGSPPDEGLIRPTVAARVSVNGRPGLVLRVRPAPAGGIHGGHYAIVWNRARAGYALSFHYYRSDSGFRRVERARPPRRRDVRALVRVAESMSDAVQQPGGSPSAQRDR